MIKTVSPLHYDITCDRCGASMTNIIRNTVSGFFGMDDCTFERICEKLLSEHTVIGWRLNPRNKTVVCQNCALIINKKKEGDQ